MRTPDIYKYFENLLLKRVEERCDINWNEMWNERDVCVCVCVCVHAHLCLSLFDPINCSPPDSSVH